MRRFFVLLLVLVLPLRAAAGDFMALGMAKMHVASAPSAAMPPDCEMNRLVAGKHDESPASSTHEAQCERCSLCLPVAQLAAWPALQTPELPEARPSAGDDDFLSVPSARSFRPPSP